MAVVNRSQKVREAVLMAAGYECQNCGSKENVESHHIVPLSQGGKDSFKNSVALCKKCHGATHRVNGEFQELKDLVHRISGTTILILDTAEKKLTPVKKAVAILLKRKGEHTNRQIAKLIGSSDSSVSDILKEWREITKEDPEATDEYLSNLIGSSEASLTMHDIQQLKNMINNLEKSN